ncbi:Rod shape-determining protein MreD [Tepidanaerobacter acetatoxydans Re1]|uniref:Rod shape-determining protein MreD n=1 Tax=Tepidanaerobacter acetatoxydans (strain DSM 21804 / JCM 16047 / Re1) TaxID=1209989 RepID=F4LW14_TEPAE|nr:rod shape-determining protein MreD [Tepidanaerobacter acetatoxydans]AEE91682.1 rod shape-determining protein MreD [Tepidanaerobacter acetatoxydans Re1]CCP26431.1 Rod shape-determining protein MreD [Tepidanaerobacter acetatoxydans Re1]
MRTIVYVLVLGVLVLVQTTLSNFIGIFGVKPDLPLVFALCMAMVKNEKAGALTGLMNGFLDDILFGRFLGLNTIAKSIAGYVVGLGSRNLYKGRVVITMVLVFTGSVIFNFVFMTIAFLTGELIHPWRNFLPITVASSLINMFVSPLIYIGTYRMERFFDYYFDIKY